jgi:hypothetical protein
MYRCTNSNTLMLLEQRYVLSGVGASLNRLLLGGVPNIYFILLSFFISFFLSFINNILVLLFSYYLSSLLSLPFSVINNFLSI